MKDYSIMNEAINLRDGGNLEKAMSVVTREAMSIMNRVQDVVREYHPSDRPLAMAAIALFADMMLDAMPKTEVVLCCETTKALSALIGGTTVKMPVPPAKNPIADKEDEDNV